MVRLRNIKETFERETCVRRSLDNKETKQLVSGGKEEKNKKGEAKGKKKKQFHLR